jgi:hypothetical protein
MWDINPVVNRLSEMIFGGKMAIGRLFKMSIQFFMVALEMLAG